MPTHTAATAPTAPAVAQNLLYTHTKLGPMCVKFAITVLQLTHACMLNMRDCPLCLPRNPVKPPCLGPALPLLRLRWGCGRLLPGFCFPAKWSLARFPRAMTESHAAINAEGACSSVL